MSKLAYPPVHPYEHFVYLIAEFDVTAAWNTIQTGRQQFSINVQTVAPRFCIPDEESIVWTTDENGRKVGKMSLKRSFKADIITDPKINLDIPLIVAQYKPSDFLSHRKRASKGEPVDSLIIDGYNRLFKAWKTGVDTLPAFVLSREETKRIIFRF